jgi:hypothetical protein
MMLSPFQEWLNASVTGRKFRITSHPTTDLEEIDPAVLAAVAADARRLVSEGKTVVIMDTGGWIRTGAVVACLGAASMTVSSLEGSLPGRGRSSSAAIGPSTTARSTQR